MPFKPEDRDEATALRKALGERIKEGRRRHAWTQEELAEAIGVGTEMLRRYERGMKFPSHLTLIRLATTLGTSVDALLGLERPADPPAPARPEELARSLKRLSTEQRTAVALVVKELTLTERWRRTAESSRR